MQASGPVPLITRVKVINYKSIAGCDVNLGPLTLLVGPNGSGKSNFLDAVHFLSDAVISTPYLAAESRGGMADILHRSSTKAETLAIEVEATVPWGPSPEQWATGVYRLTLAARGKPGRRPVEVVHELCRLTWQDMVTEFEVRSGSIINLSNGLPLQSREIESSRLLLPLFGALPNFAPFLGALENMQFYHLDPAVIRQPDTESQDAVLGSMGEHLPDVLGALDEQHGVTKERVDRYLSVIVPGLLSINRTYAGQYVSLEMLQKIAGDTLAFGSRAMSDGTLRAAAVLGALFQPAALNGRVSLVAIEEPETALHPAAAGVLFDAMVDASERVQVLGTSQSAELLDRDNLTGIHLRIVTFEDGRTIIGDIDEASQRILDKGLMTFGELMRANQLSPRRSSQH
jgi:predicted ATPase